MTELKNRRVDDILIFCVDELSGMENAINAATKEAGYYELKKLEQKWGNNILSQ